MDDRHGHSPFLAEPTLVSAFWARGFCHQLLSMSCFGLFPVSDPIRPESTDSKRLKTLALNAAETSARA